MSTLLLQSPLAGWVTPLEDVPDAVFAGKLAGDGLAIDPTGDTLHAPCDGEIVPMPGVRHAVTVKSDDGTLLLMHVGIDTVALAGEGFTLLVEPGERVRAGQPLLRFDLDLIARRARSLVTPILLASDGVISRRSAEGAIAVGDFFLELDTASVIDVDSTDSAPALTIEQSFRIPFDHGLHARPASEVVAALRGTTSAVTLLAHHRRADARSAVSMMSLGVQRDDVVHAIVVGADAATAIAALAGVLASVDESVSAPAQPMTARAPARTDLPPIIHAVIASPGLAIGLAVQLAQPEFIVPEFSADPSREASALRGALMTVRVHLDALAKAQDGEKRSILAAHAELIQDPELLRQATHWLQQGRSAAFAWRTSIRATMATFQSLGDAHLHERLADLRDLENQVISVLTGQPPHQQRALPDGAILVADELLPSQIIALDARRIAGLCTARGGPTSHVAIIAAAMGIPALVAAGEVVLGIADATPLVLDAETGKLHVAPAPSYWQAAERTVLANAAQRRSDQESALVPALTRDDRRISVVANLGAQSETSAAVAFGAEGCGLLRTEFLFLDRRTPPTEDEQWHEYQQIADGLGSRPLTIRTMDIGGDKPIPYLPLPAEENPAIGLRGLRTSLWRPELLKTQLRAILRVRGESACRILLPMVTDVSDLRSARAILDECRADLGITTSPDLGAMIETPASALLVDSLLAECDFLSIGTNDLSQYVLAMDRGHPALAPRLDALHPAVLTLIGSVAAAGHRHGKHVAVCGGLASDPAAIPILIGLGIEELSTVPAMIPRIKRIVRGLDVTACRSLAARALALPDAAAVRELIASTLPPETTPAAETTP